MGCGIANERVAAETYDDRSSCSTWAVVLLAKELLQNPMMIDLVVVHGHVALLTKELLQNPMMIDLAVVHVLWYC